MAATKRRPTAAPAPVAPVAVAKAVTDQVIAITAAWSEIRRIAQSELTRIAGK